MNSTQTNQSFSVEDIRRVRNEANARYEKMSKEEFWKDFQRRVAEAHRLKAEIKESKTNEIGGA